MTTKNSNTALLDAPVRHNVALDLNALLGQSAQDMMLPMGLPFSKLAPWQNAKHTEPMFCVIAVFEGPLGEQPATSFQALAASFPQACAERDEYEIAGVIGRRISISSHDAELMLALFTSVYPVASYAHMDVRYYKPLKAERMVKRVAPGMTLPTIEKGRASVQSLQHQYLWSRPTSYYTAPVYYFSLDLEGENVLSRTLDYVNWLGQYPEIGLEIYGQILGKRVGVFTQDAAILLPMFMAALEAEGKTIAVDVRYFHPKPAPRARKAAPVQE